MNNAWPLISAALLMGAGGSLHCMAMCAGLQRMTLRGIPVVTVRTPAGVMVEDSAEAQRTTASTAFGAVPPAQPAPLSTRTGTAAMMSAPALATTAAAADGLGVTDFPSAPHGTTAPAATKHALFIRLPDARWWRFQAGRVLGYSLLGAATGLFGQQLLAAASWQPVFESIWAGLNGLLLILGLSLLILGREPRWLAAAGARLAGSITPARWRHTEWLRGMLWAFLPCGLLYTALATAVLAATPLGAAAVMAAFAIGTNVGLLLVETGVHSLLVGSRKPQLAYRLNGLFLMLLSGVALAAALLGMEHPFC
ncbi:MAG: sulfite exporter TauE/SafE family protein [Lautropia sp.]|nr:sulfite exporter TauE/SafE family protein [Lautropia sp.]